MPPTISIVVPCYNEQATIGLLLDAILQQTYPRSCIEVVVADGSSEDGTRQAISAFQAEHPDLPLRLVDNPGRTIPAALNTAIAAARGEIILRLDAHSIPIPEYSTRCVEGIVRGKGSVVGGVWSIRPGGDGFIARGIAQAASHPLGVGDALYRLRSREGPVDTVPFGSFRCGLIKQVGGYDESLLTNEDYEFNTRVRKAGGVVWLDPAIRSTYIARASLQALAQQYWRYGYWKRKMLQRHPGSLRWRQALPPVFVASLIGLGSLSIFLPPARVLLLLETALYILLLAGAGLLAAMRRGSPLLMLGLPLAIATMHVSWGAGFLWSLVSGRAPSHG
ncbi:MAG TPA: glycosyltransferase family 2 protein [Anaerolineales bacterium]|nr:glycosyltransferase family 2 protein [Anaerolineales bacterium]